MANARHSFKAAADQLKLQACRPCLACESGEWVYGVLAL
jgi:hypothetical protein